LLVISASAGAASAFCLPRPATLGLLLFRCWKESLRWSLGGESDATLEKLAKALGVSVAMLTGEKRLRVTPEPTRNGKAQRGRFAKS
jgi:hypothetical protein